MGAQTSYEVCYARGAKALSGLLGRDELGHTHAKVVVEHKRLAFGNQSPVYENIDRFAGHLASSSSTQVIPRQ
jgi:hypothetical protein